MIALLVVDVQNDFMKGGALEVEKSLEIIPIINNLIKKFNEKKRLVVATLDWHPKEHKSFAINSNKVIGEKGILHGLDQIWWPVHCVANTLGSELYKELLPINHLIKKGTNINIDSYSGFFDNGKLEETDLNLTLKMNNITQLYIVGLATDYCVLSTVLDALELGYKVFLIQNACRGVNLLPEDSLNAIELMKKKGANIILEQDVV